LSAIITVAITDLISRPSVIKRLWDIELFDFISFQVAFWFTIFVSIEMAIFSSVAFSVLVLLYRIARPRLSVLVRLEKGGWASYDSIARQQEKESSLPLIEMTPYPGIVVFRIEEALTYPNATHLNSTIRAWIQRHTLYGGSLNPADLLWNQSPISSNSAAFISHAFESSDILPVSSESNPVSTLLAIVFDMSAVNRIDATGVQTLLDIKKDAESHSGHPVSIYFAHVNPQIQAVFSNSNDWAGEGGQTIPFPHNSTNPDAANTFSPSPATQTELDPEKQSNTGKIFIDHLEA
jgi:sodium-independent sulfate anion transporter 11